MIFMRLDVFELGDEAREPHEYVIAEAIVNVAAINIARPYKLTCDGRPLEATRITLDDGSVALLAYPFDEVVAMLGDVASGD